MRRFFCKNYGRWNIYVEYQVEMRRCNGRNPRKDTQMVSFKDNDDREVIWQAGPTAGLTMRLCFFGFVANS